MVSNAYTPEDEIAVDEQTNTIGRLVATTNTSAFFRPLHGGPEWEIERERLRPATEEEIAAIHRPSETP